MINRFIKSIGAIAGILAFVILISACGGSKTEPLFTFSPGDVFITNLKGSRKMVKADLLVEYTEKKNEKFLTENTFKIRDVVISVLREKEEANFTEEDFTTDLKSELVDMLNSTLEIDFITNIWFNELVLQ